MSQEVPDLLASGHGGLRASATADFVEQDAAALADAQDERQEAACGRARDSMQL